MVINHYNLFKGIKDDGGYGGYTIKAGDTVESWHVPLLHGCTTSFAITDESSGYVYLNLTNRFGIPLSEKAKDMDVIRRSSLLERIDTLEATLQNRTLGVRQTACECLHKIALTQSYPLRERVRAVHLSAPADPFHPNVRIMFDVVDLQPHVREALATVNGLGYLLAYENP